MVHYDYGKGSSIGSQGAKASSTSWRILRSHFEIFGDLLGRSYAAAADLFVSSHPLYRYIDGAHHLIKGSRWRLLRHSKRSGSRGCAQRTTSCCAWCCALFSCVRDAIAALDHSTEIVRSKSHYRRDLTAAN